MGMFEQQTEQTVFVRMSAICLKNVQKLISGRI